MPVLYNPFLLPYERRIFAAPLFFVEKYMRLWGLV